MTGEQSTAAANTQPRPLRRRATDRVIGGVAGGIADYLNVDPVLIRVAFVGLMIFGGAGLVLYVGAWLLIPLEGRDHSVVDAFLRRLQLRPLLLVVLALLAIILFGILENITPDNAGWIVVGVLILLGIVLLRGNETRAAVSTAPPNVVSAASAGMAAEAPAEPRPQAPRSPLGWYVVAATLIAIGLLAIADQTLGIGAAPSQFFGVALAAVGIGLVIGSWWGRTRALILPALVVVPLGVASLFLTAPLEGGMGDQRYTPVAQEELRDTYRLLGGGLTLDLRQLETRGQTVEITASVAMGSLLVLLPTEARLDIRSEVGYGRSELFLNTQYGSTLSDRYVRGDRGPAFVLNLETGIGQILAYAPGED